MCQKRSVISVIGMHGDVHGYTLHMKSPGQHHITLVHYGNGEGISLCFSEC